MSDIEHLGPGRRLTPHFGCPGDGTVRIIAESEDGEYHGISLYPEEWRIVRAWLRINQRRLEAKETTDTSR